MAITKGNIVTALNDELATSESASALSANMIRRIRAALRWLSEQGDFKCLHHYATAGLAVSEDSVNYPDNLRIIDSIVVNDGTYDSRPLEKFSDDFAGYLLEKEDLTSAGYSEPKRYAERGNKIYFAPAADKAYTVKIWFYRYHPADIDTILFGDEFTEAINSAVTAAYLNGLGRHDKAALYWNNALVELGGKQRDRKVRHIRYRDL